MLACLRYLTTFEGYSVSETWFWGILSILFFLFWLFFLFLFISLLLDIYLFELILFHYLSFLLSWHFLFLFNLYLLLDIPSLFLLLLHLCFLCLLCCDLAWVYKFVFSSLFFFLVIINLEDVLLALPLSYCFFLPDLLGYLRVII